MSSYISNSFFEIAQEAPHSPVLKICLFPRIQGTRGEKPALIAIFLASKNWQETVVVRDDDQDIVALVKLTQPFYGGVTLVQIVIELFRRSVKWSTDITRLVT